MIDVANPADVRREAERRTKLRQAGARTFEEPSSARSPSAQDHFGIGQRHHREPDSDNSHRVIDPIEYELDEKAIEHACDQFAQKAGARVVRFSHPGKTQQTPGIADRLYCFPAEKIALWFECKTPYGKQRPGQVLFEELVTSCGQQYLEGGIGDLRNWLIANCIARAEDF